MRKIVFFLLIVSSLTSIHSDAARQRYPQKGQQQVAVQPIRRIGIVSLLEPYIQETRPGKGLFAKDQKCKEYFDFHEELNRDIEFLFTEALQGKFDIVPLNLPERGAELMPYDGIEEFFSRNQRVLKDLARRSEIDGILFIYPYWKIAEEDKNYNGGLLGALITEFTARKYLTGTEFHLGKTPIITIDSMVGLFDMRSWKREERTSKPKEISSHRLEYHIRCNRNLFTQQFPISREDKEMVYLYLKQELPKRVAKVLTYMKTLEREALKNPR